MKVFPSTQLGENKMLKSARGWTKGVLKKQQESPQQDELTEGKVCSEKFDIIAMTETWLDAMSKNSSEYEMTEN